MVILGVDITEILLKVALNTIKQIGFVCLLHTDTLQE
jgi:glutamine synthetase type III